MSEGKRLRNGASCAVPNDTELCVLGGWTVDARVNLDRNLNQMTLSTKARQRSKRHVNIGFAGRHLQFLVLT